MLRDEAEIRALIDSVVRIDARLHDVDAAIAAIAKDGASSESVEAWRAEQRECIDTWRAAESARAEAWRIKADAADEADRVKERRRNARRHRELSEHLAETRELTEHSNRTLDRIADALERIAKGDR